jgi:diaminohydroxyphosphoribosylaminopyrimidine deaminase / 5-amino-6-(5-phosphoribosylamino)uracil reductase
MAQSPSRRAGPPVDPGDPDADRYWLAAAIELSARCPPSDTAFSVGAILVSAAGEMIASGYSREVDPKDHAEEVALARVAAQRVPGRIELGSATLYSSLEPCIARGSRPTPCAELIVAAGIARVVIAWHEPPVFVPGGGAAWLADHGVTVVSVPELAGRARAINAHLTG